MSDQKKPILTYLYRFTEKLFLAQVPFTDYICLADSRTKVIEEVRKLMEADNYAQLEIDYMSNFESELLQGQIISENMNTVSPTVPLELEVFKLNEDKQEGHTGYLHNYLGHINTNKKLKKSLLKNLKIHLGESDQTLARFLLNKKVENIFIDVTLSDKPKIEDFSSEKPLENAEQIIFPNQFNKGVNQLKNIAWEVDKLIQQIKNILVQQNENVILCGPVGSGKSSIIYQAIKEALVGEKQNARYYRMHARGIKGKAKYIGEKEKNIETLINKLTQNAGTLWIDEIIEMFEGEPDTSTPAILRKFMKRGQLKIIAELTKSELVFIKDFLPSFLSYFQIIYIDEMGDERLDKVLEKLQETSKSEFKIEIDTDALFLSKRLLKRFSPYEVFPGKILRFFTECLSKAQTQKIKSIDRDMIIDLFCKRTGVAELFIRDEIRLDDQKVLSFFQKKIVGQEHVVERLINIIRIFKTGLNNPTKPISTFLFAGPTGVGKTACAKTLAEFFFGKNDDNPPIIRIDMSEFQIPGDLRKLLGSESDSGRLIKEVRNRPFCVILFDEIEKAHSSIFDNLMNLLDEGVMKDNRGRPIHFKNTIIIMTSNIGAQSLSSIGFQDTDTSMVKYQSAMRAFFRPEFLNRIDEILTFHSLNPEQVKQITAIELEYLNERSGLKSKGIRLQYDNALIDHLASIGFNEKMGARPLQRAIEHQLVRAISLYLVAHQGVENCTLQVTYADNKIQVKR
jgi:ATP-dependent Clp protease ATP-binding subunit ClpC